VSDIPARNIPEEPMYLLINTAIGQFAGGPGEVKKLPGVFKIDYVRIYQDPNKIAVGCDTPKYPTAKYIANNPSRYGPPALPLGSATCP
jgi:beta-glucanase (GH16 family)